MRIVVLGAGGQLGRQLCRVLPEDIIALERAQADLTQPGELRQALAALRPGIVINAAAYTAVDRAESNARAAFAVNAAGVGTLAAICRDLECTLIHFSTNYVFGLDEARSTPYRESDTPGPINVYGHSKRAGELAVLEQCPKHFIVRTCGLYDAAGDSRSSFVATMLREGAKGQPLRVVADQVCTPTSALDLARATLQLLESDAYGLYHLTNAGACTWHELAQAIFKLKGMSAPVLPISSEEYGAPAKRPRYSVLINKKWLAVGFAPLRPWQEALADALGGCV